MNFDEFRPVRRNEQIYLNDLEAWVEKFVPWTTFTGREPRIELLPASEEDLIRATAEMIARRMVLGVAKSNASSWREAARASLHSREIYRALLTESQSSVGVRVRELIAQNAQLITTIPQDLAERVTAFVSNEQRRGTRANEIASELRRRLPKTTKSVIRRIARTEVGKSETAITRARAERLGLNWYEWATSEDQRVRLSHRTLDKVLVAWDDPPSPEALAHEPSNAGHYHPGNVWNCRCIALPLISLDEVSWPHRVYAHGRIELVSRREFERFVDLPQVA